jgi:hypothetical protein
LAVFAALGCPLLVLVGVTLAVPSMMLTQSEPPALLSALALLVPAGVLTFSIWAVFATARWAANRPSTQRRGVLKWVFVVLILAGLGWAFANRGLTRSGRSPAFENPLSNGAERLAAGKIELVALSRDPSDGTWWKPDGTPAENEVFDGGGAQPVDLKAEERRIQMVFQTPARAPEDSSPSFTSFILADAKGWAGSSQVQRHGQQMPNATVVSATFPKTLRRTTIYAGMATGPWETLAQDHRTAGSTTSMSRRGQMWTIYFQGAIEDKKGDTTLNLSYKTPLHDQYEVRAVAVTADGKEHLSLLSSKSGDLLRATFVKLPLEQIEQFHFQVRRMQWKEFSDVALEPEPQR